MIAFVRQRRPCTVVMEACGGAFARVDLLTTVADKIIVVDGKEFRKRFPKNGRKTDAVDATNLARV